VRGVLATLARGRQTTRVWTVSGRTADARAPRLPNRVTIRLRSGDGASIASRAAHRGMKPSTYIAALVRAHIARNPPWPENELAMLKQTVVVLAGLGRLMAQAAESGSGISRDDLQRTRAVVAALEERTHDLARAALISWESRSE
jgi:hypothetical protein